MSPAASTDADPNAARRRPGTRWHAGLALVAVVLAYLGIALGAAPLASSRQATGLSTIDADSQRPHLLRGERGPATVAPCEIDPPRADRPTGAALAVGSAPGFAAGAGILDLSHPSDVALSSGPRAYRSRAPPEAVRPVAA